MVLELEFDSIVESSFRFHSADVGKLPHILNADNVESYWQDDYLTKLRDYEALGIQEYWIVDYLVNFLPAGNLP